MATILLTGCSKSTTPAEAPSSQDPAVSSPVDEPAETEATEELVLTLEELGQYNGENGMPAYVAVDGVIYDFTGVMEWSGGKHNGFEAGNDLTEEIKNISPHGVARLKGVPIVGKLAE
ncbi:hypothetical protein E9840_10350 [Tissierella creatinini]|nr:hypothetical protein E9840_10350 [Tissierella creatinini]TJX64566.1 hypothetical protein E8P77_11995 [Soehngenia saccharolytica]